MLNFKITLVRLPPTPKKASFLYCNKRRSLFLLCIHLGDFSLFPSVLVYIIPKEYNFHCRLCVLCASMIHMKTKIEMMEPRKREILDAYLFFSFSIT
mmetsp:Transcript_51743/g.77402  ORF Transcript_51743/g.77402 Transcript_51743/m.77402 type:complete len:97 (-) Transcript_51743:111-401(-)